MSANKDCVKIRHLMEQAGRLPKHDSIVVLKALLATVAEEDGDWTQTLRMAIEEAEERQEAPEIHSSYRISSRQVTTFVKLFRIIYDLHIFETADGRIASNSENFINDLARFFNTEIKHTRNLFHRLSAQALLWMCLIGCMSWRKRIMRRGRDWKRESGLRLGNGNKG